MQLRFIWKYLVLLGIMITLWSIVAGCMSDNDSTPNEDKVMQKIQVALDWTPNTNHTGLYVAQKLGYFEEQGLQVEIISPNENGAETMVASPSGAASFGISYQEAVTLARTQGVPIVSIAAVIQHNTSGFASPIDKGIVSPKDFEGRTYGGWGSPVELAMIKSIMDNSNADVSKVKIVSIGDADYFTAVKRDIDFAWIFQGWTGIDAALRNEPLNMIYLKEFAAQLDYYTPVIITNEKMIKEQPELVQSFMAAVSQGYKYAIQNPELAADILFEAVPELDRELVVASQKWLSEMYQDDAPQWGIQKQEVWENYTTWMIDNELMQNWIDISKAYTNEFLPKAK